MSADDHLLARSGARVPKVLVVDDEADLRELLELTLVGMGLDVDVAGSLDEARRFLARGRDYALCLTDMRLPDGEGLELVTALAREHPGTAVAVITAFGSAENAVAALKAGAFDYLAKPLALDALRNLVRAALQAPEASGGERQPDDPTSALVGVSPAIATVRDQIRRLARSMAPVAITGESGSGKELAARLVHACGARASRPFVAVNCGAIPEALMESEFFGHRRGAFSGADQEREGLFQAASGGTLFLDEVADLPLNMQVKLLRAIQEKRVRKLGANAEEPVDVRIISATHQDLVRCVTDGRFRQDLFYRLNVIELKLPALRERPEDLPQLAEAILARVAERAGLEEPPRLSSVTVRYLQSYAFPGNVRELENLLERALAYSNGEVINVEDLGLRPGAPPEPREGAVQPGLFDAAPPGVAMPPADTTPVSSPAVPADAALAPVPVGPTPAAAPRDREEGGLRASDGSSAVAACDADGVPASLPEYLDQVEREVILRALVLTGNNRTAAARRLGVTFRALRHRMQRLGLS